MWGKIWLVTGCTYKVPNYPKLTLTTIAFRKCWHALGTNWPFCHENWFRKKQLKMTSMNIKNQEKLTLRWGGQPLRSALPQLGQIGLERSASWSLIPGVRGIYGIPLGHRVGLMRLQMIHIRQICLYISDPDFKRTGRVHQRQYKRSSLT